MRQKFTITTAIGLSCLCLTATLADAQGMGGMSGGQSAEGGRGGHHRGQRQGAGPEAAGSAPVDGRPAATTLSLAMRLTGLVVITSETKAFNQITLAIDKPDLSVILAQRNAVLALKNVNLVSSGMVSQIDDSRLAGLNSALLINSGAAASLDGVSINTSGTGANGAYVSGEGSQLTLQNSKITTRQSGAYGLEATDGALLIATNAQVTTESDHAPAVASGFHGHMTLSGGVFRTAGPDSPALSVRDGLTASGITASAGRSEGLRLEGPQNVSLTDTTLSGDSYAARLYGPDMSDFQGEHGRGEHGMGDPVARGMSGPGRGTPGDANTKMVSAMALMTPPPGSPMAHGELSISGGKLDGARAIFYVSNLRSRIVLDHVELHSEGGVILRAAAASYGELGHNGGNAQLYVRHQTLTGDFVTDVVSHISVDLKDDSHLTGKATHNTDVTLDAGSTWELAADSGVGMLTLAGVTTPDQITTILSNGHTLSYDAISNPWLDGKIYPLPGGGKLQPGL